MTLPEAIAAGYNAPAEIHAWSQMPVEGRLINPEHVGPGTTTIELRGSDGLFGPALEAPLREWGYAVVTDQATEETAVTPLAYSIPSRAAYWCGSRRPRSS